MFEGEYVQGAKNGCGRKYYPNTGRLMFEGMMKDSKWTGFGRKYYEKGHTCYEGECLNNIPHGFGRYFRLDSSLIYEGSMLKGKFDGVGRLYDEQGKLLYVGEWKDHYKHGIGSYHYDADYIFDGRWCEDKKLGGTVTVINKVKYNQIFFQEGDLDETRGKDHFRQRAIDVEEV